MGIATEGFAQDRAGATPHKLRVFFGTNAAPKSQGIYTAVFNLATGEISEPTLAGKVVNPSFLAIHPSGKLLYATCEMETADGKKVGGVSAFSVNAATGELTLLNQQPSEGKGPCHVSVDRTGKVAMVANYGSGSCASYPIGADGKLGAAASTHQHQGKSVDTARQEGPHAHSINVDAANQFAFVCDLGLDQILVYKLNAATAKLTPHQPPFARTPAGGGPRHFAFHPSGQWAFANNEMTSSVTAYAYDAEKGTLNEGPTLSTLPEEVKGNSTAETQVHGTGKFVYVSNRGHDSIAIFEFAPSTGKLTAKGHQSTGGKTPRNFCIDPTGGFILAANQGTGNVVIFKIDQATGALTPTGQKIEIPSPVCVKFMPLP